MTMSREFLYPHMVGEYYVQRVREVVSRRDAVLDGIRTGKAARAYCAQVKRKIRACFGPMPERTPLHIELTGVIERKEFRVEKLYFASRPGYWVTSNLFLPNPCRAAVPGVLALCGHSATGKGDLTYQKFCESLAAQGYAVLCIDPASQGERDQYPMRFGGRWHPVTSCVKQHIMTGNRLTLLGDHFGKWRVWDAIRGLDVLCARVEVDTGRVGVTGCSGGGTLTSYIHALDDRLTMSAPSCYITSMAHNLENELPTDSEQIIPGFLKAGLDMGDLIFAQAPRPVILLGEQHDIFDIRGFRKVYEQGRRLYRLLGHEERLQCYIGPLYHGYHLGLREAMYKFFNKTAGVRAKARDCGGKVLTEEQLIAAPGGQVKNIKGNRFNHEIMGEMARLQAQRRGTVSAVKVRELLPKVLNLPKRAGAPYSRTLRAGLAAAGSGYETYWPFALETEAGIQSILKLWLTLPQRKQFPCVAQMPALKELTLYLPHISSRNDVEKKQIIAKSGVLATLDVRGIGQSTSRTCGDCEFFLPYGSDYMYASHGAMLGESYVGRRVHDVLASLDWLEACGVKRVHLVGRGLGAVLATFAGCLHPLVKQVTLKDALRSFHDLTQTPVTAWPLSVFPESILKSLDLPDCFNILKQKRLRIVSTWNALMEPERKSVKRRS